MNNHSIERIQQSFFQEIFSLSSIVQKSEDESASVAERERGGDRESLEFHDINWLSLCHVYNPSAMTLSVYANKWT